MLILAELAALIAIAVVPWPVGLPVAIPLVAAASLFTWLRGASWASVSRSDGAALGALVGVIALGIALLVGAPLVETVTSRSVEWSHDAVVRGSGAMLVGVLLHTAVMALCMEYALRGWIVERSLRLGVLPAVLVGAIAEALLTPGELGVRVGAAVFGAGLGYVYVGAGRNVVPGMLARVVFASGVVVLQGMMVL